MTGINLWSDVNALLYYYGTDGFGGMNEELGESHIICPKVTVCETIPLFQLSGACIFIIRLLLLLSTSCSLLAFVLCMPCDIIETIKVMIENRKITNTIPFLLLMQTKVNSY